uniref:Uncharacterized protein n=1 Tax=Cacopsylla melanoneura TaxID=428564 RepID=A0A8D9B315_9HEMI
MDKGKFETNYFVIKSSIYLYSFSSKANTIFRIKGTEFSSKIISSSHISFCFSSTPVTNKTNSSTTMAVSKVTFALALVCLISLASCNTTTTTTPSSVVSGAPTVAGPAANHTTTVDPTAPTTTTTTTAATTKK